MSTNSIPTTTMSSSPIMPIATSSPELSRRQLNSSSIQRKPDDKDEKDMDTDKLLMIEMSERINSLQAQLDKLRVNVATKDNKENKEIQFQDNDARASPPVLDMSPESFPPISTLISARTVTPRMSPKVQSASRSTTPIIPVNSWQSSPSIVMNSDKVKIDNDQLKLKYQTKEDQRNRALKDLDYDYKQERLRIDHHFNDLIIKADENTSLTILDDDNDDTYDDDDDDDRPRKMNSNIYELRQSQKREREILDEEYKEKKDKINKSFVFTQEEIFASQVTILSSDEGKSKAVEFKSNTNVVNWKIQPYQSEKIEQSALNDIYHKYRESVKNQKVTNDENKNNQDEKQQTSSVSLDSEGLLTMLLLEVTHERFDEMHADDIRDIEILNSIFKQRYDKLIDDFKYNQETLQDRINITQNTILFSFITNRKKLSIGKTGNFVLIDIINRYPELQELLVSKYNKIINKIIRKYDFENLYIVQKMIFKIITCFIDFEKNIMEGIDSESAISTLNNYFQSVTGFEIDEKHQLPEVDTAFNIQQFADTEDGYIMKYQKLFNFDDDAETKKSYELTEAIRLFQQSYHNLMYEDNIDVDKYYDKNRFTILSSITDDNTKESAKLVRKYVKKLIKAHNARFDENEDSGFSKEMQKLNKVLHQLVRIHKRNIVDLVFADIRHFQSMSVRSFSSNLNMDTLTTISKENEMPLASPVVKRKNVKLPLQTSSTNDISKDTSKENITVDLMKMKNDIKNTVIKRDDIIGMHMLLDPIIMGEMAEYIMNNNTDEKPINEIIINPMLNRNALVVIPKSVNVEQLPMPEQICKYGVDCDHVKKIYNREISDIMRDIPTKLDHIKKILREDFDKAKSKFIEFSKETRKLSSFTEYFIAINKQFNWHTKNINTISNEIDNYINMVNAGCPYYHIKFSDISNNYRTEPMIIKENDKTILLLQCLIKDCKDNNGDDRNENCKSTSHTHIYPCGSQLGDHYTSGTTDSVKKYVEREFDILVDNVFVLHTFDHSYNNKQKPREKTRCGRCDYNTNICVNSVSVDTWGEKSKKYNQDNDYKKPIQLTGLCGFQHTDVQIVMTHIVRKLLYKVSNDIDNWDIKLANDLMYKYLGIEEQMKHNQHNHHNHYNKHYSDRNETRGNYRQSQYKNTGRSNISNDYRNIARNNNHIDYRDHRDHNRS
jgi:hypothetical protein